MKPMLLNEVELERIERYVTNHDYWLEEKIDGRRLLLDFHCEGPHRERMKLVGYGRDGQKVSIPDFLLPVYGLRDYGSFTFDGEVAADPSGRQSYWVFDLLRAADRDGSQFISIGDPAWLRRDGLEAVMGKLKSVLPAEMQLVPRAFDPDAKRRQVLAIQQMGGEGVVFKHRDRPYQPGKKNAAAVKAKFTKTLDAVVTNIGMDGKENIEISVWKDHELVEIGRCSTAGKVIPGMHDVVEVRYLYALRADALTRRPVRLYQARLLRIRDDKPSEACTFDQIQFSSKRVLRVET